MVQNDGSLRTMLFFQVLLSSSRSTGANFVNRPKFNIPGTTQTNDGYDTELGTNSICWFSHGPGPTDFDKDKGHDTIPFPNPLIADFVLGGSGVQPLKDCPVGNHVRAEAPLEFRRDGKLRVENFYLFNVFVSLNVTSLIEGRAISNLEFQSDDEPKVAIQIMACDIESAGFCTPFKHEESNLRNAAMNMTQKVAKGDLHGGSHIHSEYVFQVLYADDGPVFEFQLPLPMKVNVPGKYFHIVALHLFFRDWFFIDSRYDIANAMPLNERLITYQAQTVILVVPSEIRYVSYVAIVIASSIIGYLLFHTIRNRDHQVLKLTQGGFLIVFLCAALTMSVSCFLLEPRQHPVYCRAGTPILLIAAQLFYAVTLGRLWRINAVISPLLAKTLRQQERSTFFSWIRSLLMNSSAKEEAGRKLRAKVQSGQLATRILFFTAPQVIIQLGLAIVEPMRYSVFMNEDESIGSAHCSSGKDGWFTLHALGYTCFCCLVLILVLTAHQTRILPSLFNETRVIFDSTLATLVIVILGMGIMAVSNNPTTSPAVSYLLGITLTLSSTLNTSLRIMMPKLRMIWRGETVLVSKLVSDHKQAVLKDDMLYKHSRRASATEHAHAAPDETTFRHGEQSRYNNASTSSTVGGDIEFEDFLGGSGLDSSRPKLVIHQDEAPAKWFVLRLIDMQSKLSRINDRIMSGTAVTREEWEILRKTSQRLSSTFRRKVCFAWEVENDGGICFSEEAARSLDLTRDSNRVSSAIMSEESFIFRSVRSLRDTPILLDDTERIGNPGGEPDEEYPIREVRFQLPEES